MIPQEMNAVSLSIRTGGTDAAPVMSLVGAGIDNMQEQLNETVRQYKFLPDAGFSRHRVTGMAPAWTLAGHRVWGDPAQDYIFDGARKYGLGASRETQAEVAYTVGGYRYTIAFDCTLCNIQEWSGSADEESAVSFELRVNGAPTVTRTAVSD